VPITLTTNRKKVVGESSGTVRARNFSQPEAPSIEAASKTSRGSACMAER
jgi:hypothetical protein